MFINTRPAQAGHRRTSDGTVDNIWEGGTAFHIGSFGDSLEETCQDLTITNNSPDGEDFTITDLTDTHSGATDFSLCTDLIGTTVSAGGAAQAGRLYLRFFHQRMGSRSPGQDRLRGEMRLHTRTGGLFRRG